MRPANPLSVPSLTSSRKHVGTGLPACCHALRGPWVLTFTSLPPISCSPKASEKKQFFVAFSQCNNAEPYRAAQNELMQKLFAEAGGVKLVIADGQQDNSKQVAQVETFIRQNPDLLIVAPNERAALTAIMGQAIEAKIPVICLERDILLPHYTTYVHR